MICYLDLDGVIVDFIGGTSKEYNLNFPYGKSSVLYNIMDTNYKVFFEKLPPLKSSDIFFNLYTKYSERVYFLSAVPSHWDSGMRLAGTLSKFRWLKQYLPSLTMENLIVVGNKVDKARFYASEKSILVDDHPTTISDWISNGGVGFDFPSHMWKEEQIVEQATNIVETIEKIFSLET